MATYFTSCISFKNNADLNFYFSFSFLFHYAQCARFCFIIFVVFQWQLKVNWFRCFWVGVQEILYHWAGPMLSFSLPWPLRMWKYCSPTCFTLQILSIAFAPIHQESLNIHAVEWKSTGFYMFNNHQSNQGYHLLQKTINEVSMCLFITVYKINNHRHHRRVTKNAYLCTFQVHKWSKTWPSKCINDQMVRLFCYRKLGTSRVLQILYKGKQTQNVKEIILSTQIQNVKQIILLTH